jgi:hypothetical protein
MPKHTLRETIDVPCLVCNEPLRIMVKCTLIPGPRTLDSYAYTMQAWNAHCLCYQDMLSAGEYHEQEATIVEAAFRTMDKYT